MRKESVKTKRLWIGGATILLVLSLLLAFALGAGSAFAGTTSGGGSESAREYFSFPSEVVSTGTVGVKTPVARITPTNDKAQNYTYGVFLDGDAVALCSEYAFLPEKAGDYTVHYHYVADGDVHSYSYVITVTAADGPVFDRALSLPHAFVSGRPYTLPTLTAADWSGGEKRPATVTVSVKVGGAEVSLTNNSFVPELAGDYADAEIVYTAEVGGKTETVSATVPILKVYGEDDKVDFKSLFATRGFDDVTATEDCVVFRSFGNAEARYANVIGSDGMTIEFGFGSERYQAESLVLTIESYEDPSVAVSIGFEKGRKQEGAGVLRLNGGATKNYDFTAGERFSVTVDETRSRLTDASGNVLFNLTEDMSGSTFYGFPGGRVKIKIAVEGSYGSSELCVYKINSQNLSTYEYDEVLPGVTLPAIAREYTVGDTITVPAVYAVDIVDPAAKITASVRQLTSYLKDVNGVELNKVNASEPMTFKAEKAGSINVQYSVSDASGNSYIYPFLLTVFDRTDPTLTVNGSVSGSVKVGSTLTLPGASAADNDGVESLLMQIIVVYPTMYVKQPASSIGTGSLDATAFTFDAPGEYKIWYVATDDYGNYVRQEFTIKAEA